MVPFDNSMASNGTGCVRDRRDSTSPDRATSPAQRRLRLRRRRAHVAVRFAAWPSWDNKPRSSRLSIGYARARHRRRRASAVTESSWERRATRLPAAWTGQTVQLLSGECGPVEKFAAPVRLADQPRPRVGCLERGRPVTLIGERLIPGDARLRRFVFRAIRCQTTNAVRTKDGFAQPSLVLGLPLSALQPADTVGGASPTAEGTP